MKSYKWIKLYHEVLDDPKMGKMSDHLWRRTIEFFLLAGKAERGGELPPIEDMVWTLRTTEKEIMKCLGELEALGIVTLGEVISVTNFEKRQESYLTDAEKQQRHREKQQENYEVLPEPVTNVTEESNNEVTNVTKESNTVLPTEVTNVYPRLREELREDKDKEKEIKEKDLSAPAKTPEAKPKNKESPKKVYGEFENITLTDQEYQKLQERFPDCFGDWIEKLSAWKESKGKKTKSDYATILNWARMDKAKNPEVKREDTGWKRAN